MTIYRGLHHLTVLITRKASTREITLQTSTVASVTSQAQPNRSFEGFITLLSHFIFVLTRLCRLNLRLFIRTSAAHQLRCSARPFQRPQNMVYVVDLEEEAVDPAIHDDPHRHSLVAPPLDLGPQSNVNDSLFAAALACYP